MKIIKKLSLTIPACILLLALSTPSTQASITSTSTDNKAYLTGKKYYFGDGVLQDYVLANEWLLKAANSDNHDAEFLLGRMSLDGNGQPENLIHAFEWFDKAASSGSAEHLLYLAHCYYYGIGTTQNFRKAIYIYQQSAEKGSHDAQLSLAIMHFRGHGSERSESKAMEWISRATQDNNAEAQYRLGRMFEEGIGVARNMEQAKTWYTKSAEQGYALAQYKLGYLLKFTQFSDPAQSMDWIEKAAQQGYSLAAENLAKTYEDNNRKLTADKANHAQAYIWSSIALVLGVSQLDPHSKIGIDSRKNALTSNRNMAAYHLQKNGSPDAIKSAQKESAKIYDRIIKKSIFTVLNDTRSHSIAADFIRLAKLYHPNSNADQQQIVFEYTSRTDQIPQDYLDALFSKAQTGDAIAQFKLGYMFLNGIGISINHQAGIHWLTKSAQQNNLMAAYQLGEIYLNGILEDKNFKPDCSEAAKWYSTAGLYGSTKAAEKMYNLYSNTFAYLNKDCLNPVKTDKKQAYIWKSVTIANGFTSHFLDRDKLLENLDSEIVATYQDEAAATQAIIQQNINSQKPTEERCFQPKTITESLGCQHPDITALQEQLRDIHRSALEQATDKALLERDQKNWEQYSRDSCINYQCLKIAYENRIAFLQLQSAQQAKDSTKKITHYSNSVITDVLPISLKSPISPADTVNTDDILTPPLLAITDDTCTPARQEELIKIIPSRYGPGYLNIRKLDLSDAESLNFSTSSIPVLLDLSASGQKVLGSAFADIIYADPTQPLSIEGHRSWESGPDFIHGGQGNDFIQGGGRDDSLSGDDDDDILIGDGPGMDPFYQGDDYLYGGNGHDNLLGDGGNDYLEGGNDNDMLLGDSTLSPERLHGSDQLSPERSHGSHQLSPERLHGSHQFSRNDNSQQEKFHGQDILLGCDGDDSLFGNGSDDILAGGSGNDLLNGGSGNDIYIINMAVEATDRISDASGKNTLIIINANVSDLALESSSEGKSTALVFSRWFSTNRVEFLEKSLDYFSYFQIGNVVYKHDEFIDVIKKK